MNAERRRQIRAYAVRRVASELRGVVNGWGGEVQEELYPDEEEAAEFDKAIYAIIRQLERRGGDPAPSDPRR